VKTGKGAGDNTRKKKGKSKKAFQGWKEGESGGRPNLVQGCMFWLVINNRWGEGASKKDFNLFWGGGLWVQEKEENQKKGVNEQEKVGGSFQSRGRGGKNRLKNQKEKDRNRLEKKKSQGEKEGVRGYKTQPVQ